MYDNEEQDSVLKIIDLIYNEDENSYQLNDIINCSTIIDTDYNIVVESEFLRSGDRILLVDDFLANGKALEGLLELVQQAGAEVVGAGIAIEKGLQEGGSLLRQKGLRIESLAIVEKMEGSDIFFRNT